MTMPNPTPIPEMEIGTWVKWEPARGGGIHEVSRQDDIDYVREHADGLVEARFPDGRIWRREEQG